MQRRTHASLGAWTLTASGATPVDAARSIELVGASQTTTGSVRPDDPVAAARRWLSDPTRARALDPLVRLRAEQAITIAEEHLFRLDRMALELTIEVAADGTPDQTKLAVLDEMAEAVVLFSGRLRELLDPARPAPDAESRLMAGIDASESGGLSALVAAL